MLHPVTSRRAEATAGFRASLSAGLGLFPLGLSFGLLVAQAGLSWWVAPALSIFVYAGSMELLLISLITAATPLVTIALTTRPLLSFFTLMISPLRPFFMASPMVRASTPFCSATISTRCPRSTSNGDSSWLSMIGWRSRTRRFTVMPMTASGSVR